MKVIVKTGPSGQQGKLVMVVVGKTIFKKATDRNLLKRRIRSILIPISKKLKVDFRVIAKPSAGTLDFLELKNELLSQVPNRPQ